jgi:subtilisin
MKSFISGILVLSVIFITSCDNDNEKGDPDDCVSLKSINNGAVIEDRYIISLPSDENDTGGRKSLKALRLLQRNHLSDERLLNSFRGKNTNMVVTLTKAEAAQLSLDKEIIKIEPDRVVSMCACFTVVEPKLVTWNVSKVGYGDGTGKTAWVLDTGIDLDHPDLNVDQARSKSFIEGVDSPEDDNGHGTHIAGVIGAKNNRVGTLGVASDATIVGLKVLDEEGNGTVSSVLDALAYVSENAEAGQVVNISLSVENLSDILDVEIQSLANRGIFIAIAAGNEETDASNYSPGRANGKNIYTISAVDSLDRFATWSNYGNDAIDYAAPGVRILSTYAFGKYAYMSGTSMAAPHVAGILLINNGTVNTQGSALNDPDGVSDPIAHK